MIKLNNKTIKHSIALSNSLNIIFGLLFIFFISLICTHTASATGETYTYGNSGAQIGGTGGVLGTKNVLFNKSASTYVKQVLSTNGLPGLNTPTYNAYPIFVVADSKNSNGVTEKYMMFSGSAQVPSGKSTCMAGVEIFVKFGDSANGLAVPTPDVSGQTISAKGSTVISPCPTATVSAISEFHFQSIKIGGNTSVTTPVTDVAETAETKQISVSVYSDKPASKLPSGIKVDITSITQSSGTTFASTSDPLSFNNTYAVNQVFFKNVTDGTYKICITPENIFAFEQCQTVTKGYAYLNVYFGSQDTAYYIDGKVVEATVSITMPSTRPQGTYGPKTIALEDANSKVLKTSNTDSHLMNSDDSLSDPIVLKAKFDGIEPGTYKVCINDIADLCSAVFTKKVNTKAAAPDAQINISADKSAQLLTAPSVTASCGDQVPGMGWILCPIISGLTSLNDAMWGLVSSLLKVNPLNQSDTIYNAWGTIRNLANIVFVIIFLIMIFSQLSSVGISNYGVKKLLPRLLIGAILVNVSFIVVQISVDLANILGSSLYDLLAGLAPKAQPTWGTLVNLIIQGGLGVGLAVGGIALVGGVAAAFWMLLPMAAMGALGLLAAVLTLIFRQAIIPVLAILAPLAFVAYLLPNTESWFKKWRNLFFSMLTLYPLAAVIFGGAQFAAGTIIGTGSDWWKLLIGLIMLTLPLFSLPFIAAKSGSLITAVGGALNGLVNKSKAPIGKVTGGYAERAKLQTNNRALNSTSRLNPRRALLQRNARLEAIKQNQEREFARSQTGYIAKIVSDKNGKFVSKMIKGGSQEAIDRAKASAVTSLNKADDEQVNNAAVLIRSMTNPIDRPKQTQEMLTRAIQDRDIIKSRAALSVLLSSGAPGIANAREALAKITEDKSNTELNNTSTLNALRADINASGLKGKDNILSSWGYKGTSISDITKDPETFSKLNAVELAGQDENILKGAASLVDIKAITPENPNGYAITGDQARKALSNPNAAQNLTAAKISILEGASRRDPAPSDVPDIPTAPTIPIYPAGTPIPPTTQGPNGPRNWPQ